VKLLRYGILGGVGVFVAILGWQRMQADPLLIIGKVPSFSLVSANGKTVSSENLKGNIWIADFIFTRCAGICPVMMGQMHQLQSDFTARDLRFVSITVDPEHDTPTVLGQYGEQHGVDTNRWIFLTGDKDTVFTVAKDGFRLATKEAKSGEDEPILHSPHFVLVDRKGQIRGYYNGTDAESVDQLRADLKRLL